MTLAGQWYSSGTFWTAAGTIAILLTGAIATLVALWLANPVRRLECEMSAAPLLQGAAQEMPGKLRITWDNDELHDPHILEVNLINRGRSDIYREEFDQALELRVGARILAVLRTAAGPESSPFNTVAFEDDLLRVGPGLIRRHQSVKITLLAVGPTPALSSSAAALHNVDVKVVPPEPSHRRWPTRVKLAAGFAVIAVATGLVLLGLLIGHNPSPSTRRPPIASPSRTPRTSLATASLRAAEADLKSGSETAQLNGVKTLQGLMKTLPNEQPAVIQALATFIHTKSPAKSNDLAVTSVVQQALNVLKVRQPAHDGDAVINLNSTNFTGANLIGIDLSGASLVNTDFTTANLSNANLRGANLNYAFFGGANLVGANLAGANLDGASLYQTTMCQGSVPTQPQLGYNCSATG